MAVGRLSPPAGRSEASLLAEQLGPEDRLGQRPRSWAVIGSCDASSQPLGDEEALRAGLTAGVSRLKVWLYTRERLTPHYRVRLDGVTYRLVQVEPWQHYVVVIAEHLEG